MSASGSALPRVPAPAHPPVGTTLLEHGCARFACVIWWPLSHCGDRHDRVLCSPRSVAVRSSPDAGSCPQVPSPVTTFSVSVHAGLLGPRLSPAVHAHPGSGGHVVPGRCQMQQTEFSLGEGLWALRFRVSCIIPYVLMEN